MGSLPCFTTTAAKLPVGRAQDRIEVKAVAKGISKDLVVSSVRCWAGCRRQ